MNKVDQNIVMNVAFERSIDNEIERCSIPGTEVYGIELDGKQYFDASMILDIVRCLPGEPYKDYKGRIVNGW